MGNSVDFPETEFRRLSWLWANSYDSKDWKQLRSICTDTFKMFYGDLDPRLGNQTVPTEEFVATMSAQTALGDHRLKTMHFLGAVVFERSGDDVMACWQIQGLHRRELSDGSVTSWNGYNYVQHFYELDGNGEWKLAGVKPSKPLFMDGSPHQVIGVFG
ncbi:hypothetical protein E4T44_00414 [Aureobasidium sp. EXF-8845]|nr:hypothetical protein E4T44_00414 [Aureobasidium sp. EXF-8845]KAI4858043.1 hypothetical protein E4T45_00453 [Aureobasidium sp. EXF-8846]